jgi:hypothetical protein
MREAIRGHQGSSHPVIYPVKPADTTPTFPSIAVIIAHDVTRDEGDEGDEGERSGGGEGGGAGGMDGGGSGGCGGCGGGGAGAGDCGGCDGGGGCRGDGGHCGGGLVGGRTGGTGGGEGDGMKWLRQLGPSTARENGRQSACTTDEGGNQHARPMREAISMPSTERERELRAHAKVRRAL